MSKVEGKLYYKDWCILKHALDRTIKEKKDILDVDTLVTTNNLSPEKKITIEKELSEEKETLKRVTEITNKFKKYIGGGRHY